ncbi:MAG: TonB-dependent receptor [Lysobacteraceae bacterium SCN 69-48]|nr:MAG: TonB-dependent receptor [Xanthomonadaceae bacterium SCN 69-48]
MASKNRTKSLKRSVLTLALGLCFVGAAIAANSGGLRISIKGADGQPVAGATVKLSSPSSLVSKSGVTDANGNVNIVGLDPATNYTVEVQASGYSPFSSSNVAVVSDKNLSVGYVLGRTGGGDATNLDAIVVTGASLAAVDTTSATVSTVLTLEQVEALPTARSYQSYLQLVPGVKPSSGGNPSSKSGVNYADIGGAVGQSTDNLYYIDGVNVTDPLTGTFGSNLNSEIIQEMQVMTGGVPAEFAGGAGLISKVITKSGGNEFHGSINYYLQNSNLVAKNKHLAASEFSTYDAAVTLGGPILKDRIWFFGSFQKKNHEEDVTDPVSQQFLRSVSRKSDLAFGKITWQISDNDRLTATFFNDPTTISGSLNPSTVNSRSNITEQGGDNYKVDYSHDWESFSIGAYAFRHEGQLSSLASTSDPFNNVAYHTGRATKTNADLNMGGSGANTFTNRDNKEFGLNFDWYLSSSWGEHTIRGGVLRNEGSYTERVAYLGAGAAGARYTSISAADAGITLADYFSSAYGWRGTRQVQQGDLARIEAATGMTSAQLLASTLSDTTGNPDGMVNVYRILQSANEGLGYTVVNKQTALFLQDQWTLGQWSANVGARFERNEMVNSAGGSIHKFDWDIAPRVSLTYDLDGDGRSKIWGFYGRYYDPVRADMADFAGAVTGPTYDEQVNINGTWYTYRQRGPGDAAVAPTTKTPYTDEIMLGFATTFGTDVGLSIALTSRKTRDLLEDYDLTLYSDPTTPCGSYGAACPSSPFFIPYEYFGYSGNPGTNYVLATLVGGKRNYHGFEVTLQKYKSDNWQAAANYTFNGAKGNSNSDGNADFQGDWIALDPRAPNQYGPQPGNIKHQFKAWGSYEFDFGLELSGVFNWNSGVLYSRTFSAYGRNLPEMGPDYVYGDVEDSWLAPGAVGGENGPAYYTLDVRAKYTRPLPVGKIEVFLDVFNILDKQSATSEMDLLAGNGVYAFGQANAWVEPRRAYLGVRYSF